MFGILSPSPHFSHSFSARHAGAGRSRGAPVTREEAIRDVWEFGYAGNTNVIDVYIRCLRKKLDERFDARFNVTVRVRGYMLR